MSRATPTSKVQRLGWSDEDLGSISFPRAEMRVRASFGSGLTRRPGNPPGVVWAVGDRGPNLKIKTMVGRYGADHLRAFETEAGVKVMPRLDLGPAIAMLRIAQDRVELVQSLRLRDAEGHPVSGLPVPGGDHARREPALDLDGNRLEPDPRGFDTEGIAGLPDGGFWVGDEFGPSLVRLDEQARVIARYVPEGLALEHPAIAVGRLPAIAARRQINRGFEAIALSGDAKWLFLAFQSPLAHPDEAAHEKARHVRLWRLDANSMEVAAQYLYPLDSPESFVRDWEKGKIEWSDLKVSELAWAGENCLLVLERASETTKIYRCRLAPEMELPPEHLDESTRPSVEELSGAAGSFELPVLAKDLLFSSDDAPEVAADLEGMALLSPSELLLVNDNDFGVEGAETSFWRISFDDPIAG